MSTMAYRCPSWIFYIHPGRLTWDLQITHLEKNMIYQTSMIRFHDFHVNLQGCKAPDTFHDKVPSMHNDYDETTSIRPYLMILSKICDLGSCDFLRSFVDPRHLEAIHCHVKISPKEPIYSTKMGDPSLGMIWKWTKSGPLLFLHSIQGHPKHEDTYWRKTRVVTYGSCHLQPMFSMTAQRCLGGIGPTVEWFVVVKVPFRLEVFCIIPGGDCRIELPQ